jgi:hypothetical protein
MLSNTVHSNLFINGLKEQGKTNLSAKTACKVGSVQLSKGQFLARMKILNIQPNKPKTTQIKPSTSSVKDEEKLKRIGSNGIGEKNCQQRPILSKKITKIGLNGKKNTIQKPKNSKSSNLNSKSNDKFRDITNKDSNNTKVFLEDLKKRETNPSFQPNHVQFFTFFLFSMV